MFQKQNLRDNQNIQEEEVFRITPQENKAYETAIYTREETVYDKEKFWHKIGTRYYTTNPVVYAGIAIKNVTFGYGDASYGYVLFNKNGVEEKVEYTYEGTRCFREVPIQPCVVPSLTSLSSQVVKTHNDLDALKEKMLLSIN